MAVSYINQINGFWNWRKLNHLSHAAADLYYAVLDCANTSGWKESFTIPNSTLQRLCEIGSPNELNKQRNILVQSGLITYQKGRKGQAGTYTLIPLYRNYTGYHPGENTGYDSEKQARNIYKEKDKDQKRSYYHPREQIYEDHYDHEELERRIRQKLDDE